MEYRVLGSLEVVDGSGRRLPLGGARQQTVLASLVLRAGRTVPLQRLVDELWEKPPETAAKTVQVYVSRLRSQLEAGAIESRHGGYALMLDGDQLDLAQFEQISGEGREALAAGDCERAAQLLHDALALWRGPALSGLPSEMLRREAERLEELRLQALEDRLEADLGRGRERDVVAELQPLVAEHPFRERLHALLMLALYRSGRQTEALDVYRETRRLLAEQLGLEPSENLRQLERRMLAHDPELEVRPPEAMAPAKPTRPPEQPIRARRPATVVFADLVGSTGLGEQLDPESVHAVLDRYSRISTTVLERHGGTVEKFIGDAIVGIFGLTDVHEDDALRAVRAAVELRDAAAELGEELKRTRGIDFAVKLGVNSGDVFVGTGSQRGAFATGDPINVAARLEQMADAHEILVGERTYRLVQAHVRAEELEPLVVKGRTAEVHAWRLLELTAEEQVPVRPATPFVGRERELDELRAALARTHEDHVCRLFTVVGPAGIGKTRLAREFLGELSDSATVAVGRCLSYGEAITYHALIEIVKQLAGEDPDRQIAELIDDPDEAELVARRLRATIGLSDETAPPEETFWAVRRLFEAVARERPLVAVVEDVHWAEPMLVDLLEYIVSFCAAAPIFILCLARPELLESRSSWAAPHANRSLVDLAELSEPAARKLVESLAAGELERLEAERIVQTAEGNPLFLEQLVATQAERGESELPPSVHAVLAARIARLDPGERTVLERAAVEGRNFKWSSVATLLPESERAGLGRHLMALMRRQLIQPDPSALAGEDAFRFSHVLIQEAAYSGLPKELCSELHERLANRLGLTTQDGEDEIVGYHLEQAYRCREQLGLVGDRERALAREAKTRLEAAARKALLRGDAAAAAGMLERAASLLAPDDPSRLDLLPALGAALFEAGRLGDADRVLTEAIERSADELLEARARVEQQFVQLQTDTSAVHDVQRIADAALKVFEQRGDDFGQIRAWCLKAFSAWIGGHAAKADEAWQRAAEHARRAGEKRELFEILDWRASAAVVGPTPVDEAIDMCLEIREQVRSSPVAVAETLHPLGVLHAMRGEFDTARSLVREGNAIVEELGRIYSAGLSHHEAFVEMLAGEPEVAEERLRRAYETLQEMGEKTLLASTSAYLAQAIYAQDRPEEAVHFCEVSRELAADEDLSAQVVGKGTSAKILAGQGRGAEAEALAREAVELAERTDLLTHRGQAFLDLAEVLQLNGQPAEAESALRAGLELYDRKGDLVSAERARTRLEQVFSA
jgi:class 3 adenylate cyclase/tetratricopeptide (TPR) repeat protein